MTMMNSISMTYIMYLYEDRCNFRRREGEMPRVDPLGETASKPRPPPLGCRRGRNRQSFSNASIAAAAVMWALAGFAPVTIRPLETENGPNGSGGAP